MPVPGGRVTELFHVSQEQERPTGKKLMETHLRLSRGEHSCASSQEEFKPRVFNPAVMREIESWNREAEGEM